MFACTGAIEDGVLQMGAGVQLQPHSCCVLGVLALCTSHNHSSTYADKRWFLAPLPSQYLGQASCIPSICNKGMYSASSSVSSSSSPVTKAPVCASCPSGTYGSVRGLLKAEDCNACSAGKFGAATVGATTAGACRPCAPGKYADQKGQTSCKLCAGGSASGVGAVRCGSCFAGKKLSSTSIGGSSSGAGECTDCPAGRYSLPESSICLPCDPGKSSDPGDPICTACEPGTYGNATGDGCLDCRPGRFSAAQSAVCTPCAAGQYLGSAKGTACDGASKAECVIAVRV